MRKIKKAKSAEKERKQKPRVVREPFSPRKWTKEKLVREDWDFSSAAVPGDRLLSMVLMYELDRESAASDAGPILLSEHGTFIRNHGNFQTVLEGPLETFALGPLARDILKKPPPDEQHFIPAGTISPSGATVNAFRIEWSQTEAELMERFKSWLRTQICHPGYSCGKPTSGRNKELRPLLWKLGAYRLHSAGYSRLEALGMLNSSNISAPNWAALKRKVKRLIRRAWEIRRTPPRLFTDSSSTEWSEGFVSRLLGKNTAG